VNRKILTTSVATAALVGALGLAYAQTYSSDPAAPPADRSTQQAMPERTPAPMPDTTAPSATVAPSDSSASTLPATSSPGSAPNDASTMAEPAPQPDRG
jgi:hypothetical protein